MRPVRALVLCAGLLLAGAFAQAAPGYYRHPDLHGNRLVFCAEGDLWTAADSGGMARRLTSHPGTEYFPRFSPDGTSIAFTGEYDGNRDVFIVPADGGEPRRLTWHPGADEVVGWTPDGTKVIFRSRRENALAWELFTIPAAGGDPAKLPLGWAVRLDIDPASGMWAFNRKSWEQATWKRYRGGTAPDIWVGHPDRADFRPVTTFAGSNAFPMWAGGRIWFLSDQGGTANFWSIRPDGSDRQRHTSFEGWDARWPAMSRDGRITFVLGADVHVLDTKTGAVRKVDIDMPSERALARVRYPDPGRYLTSFALSPKGDRVAVVTRGEIFSIPVKEGVTLPVTRGSGARESFAAYSPDGRRLAYVSDATREEDLRTIDAWGRGEPTVVRAAGAKGLSNAPAWSPDGSWIAWSDSDQALWIVPAKGGAPKLVKRGEYGGINDYVFSPDGRWLAFSTPTSGTFYSAIFIHDTKTGATHRVTGPSTNDMEPAWDPDGRYLYFLSDRATNPLLDHRDMQNIEYANMVPMMVLLRRDAKNPFAPAAGLPEDEPAKDAKKADGKKDGAAAKDAAKKDGVKAEADDAKDETPKPVGIDLEGLGERIVRLPKVKPGFYGEIGATAGTVYLLSMPFKGMADAAGFFEESEPENTILAYDLEKKEVKPFAEGVLGFEVAAKAGKIGVLKGQHELFVVDAGSGPADFGSGQVSLGDVVLELDPRAEWEQIYYEAWRQERESYFDPEMGGLDWKALRDRYATLLPRLATRADLRDLLGELLGELSTSHSYVFGGDDAAGAGPVPTGLLGADVVREGAAYKVTRIYRPDPADGVRSALAEPGVDVKEGEYIVSVNNRPFPGGAPFYAAFAGLAGKGVLLGVNSKPARDGARTVLVRTLPDDTSVRYSDWVRRNREYVAQKTGGRIGYLHIPDMGNEGMIAFNTWFYPQLDKDGLIVDVRWNGGGFVSQMIVERLRRRIVSFDRARGGVATTYPFRTLNGPFVVLTNEFAGSDGDIFPAAIQLEKLAPVIGMRSWGGVVGINGVRPLVDGGMVTNPQAAWWQPQGGWAIENHGVEPDIVVQNAPQELAKGIDAQLDRGIGEVLALCSARPKIVPNWGPVPPRSREAYHRELEKAPEPAGGAVTPARM